MCRVDLPRLRLADRAARLLDRCPFLTLHECLSIVSEDVDDPDLVAPARHSSPAVLPPRTLDDVHPRRDRQLVGVLSLSDHLSLRRRR
jgi:hypothetical protein